MSAEPRVGDVVIATRVWTSGDVIPAGWTRVTPPPSEAVESPLMSGLPVAYLTNKEAHAMSEAVDAARAAKLRAQVIREITVAPGWNKADATALVDELTNAIRAEGLDVGRVSVALQRAGALSDHISYADLARCFLAALTDGRDDLGAPDEHDQHARHTFSAIRAEGLDRLKFLREDAERQWNLATSKVDKAYHAGRMTALSDVALSAEAER